MAVLGPVTLCLFALPLSPVAGAGCLQEDGFDSASAPLTSVSGAVDAACLWLQSTQAEDGHWRATGLAESKVGEADAEDDEFWARALGEPVPASRAVDASHDIGVTSLALYALMTDVVPAQPDGYEGALRRGLGWLLSQQDPGTGRFGRAEGFGVHYGHAMATLALATAMKRPDPGAKLPDSPTSYADALKGAVRYIESARNPYGAWRYASPPDGDNDTSITAWMTLALTAAEEAGCEVADEAFLGAEQWFVEMTDLESGRVGYMERGSASARVPGSNDSARQEGAETLTAGALLARLRMGADTRTEPLMVAHVKLALSALRDTSTDRLEDAIWVFWGTAAMADVGSLPWVKWSPSIRSLLLGTQVREGAEGGSWDPDGAWGYALGRTGTTALCAAALAILESAGGAAKDDALPQRVAEGPNVDQNVRMGLAWLAAHQDADGGWSADRFMRHDPEGDQTDGAGDAQHAVGVTGLAILAFMGDGNNHLEGEHHAVLSRGLEWLRQQQDHETGLIGLEIGSYLYDHAIASLAIVEAYVLTGDESLHDTAQRCVNYIARARNPYGVWRYSVPPTGDNDTSVTAWMVQALRSAADAGLKIDSQAFEAATAWVNEMTDPATGRVGYTEQGSRSSRVPGMNDAHPTEVYEALTAAGLYTLFLAGGDSSSADPVHVAASVTDSYLKDWLIQRADLVVGTAEALADPTIPRDLYAIYYGSRAMFAMGGTHWTRWSRALRAAVLDSQRQDGAARGSYDPSGPWGYSGGRVYATSMMILSALMVKRDDELKR